MSNVPDYYSILEIPVSSTQDEIREGKFFLIVTAKQLLNLIYMYSV